MANLYENEAKYAEDNTIAAYLSTKEFLNLDILLNEIKVKINSFHTDVKRSK